MDALRSVRQRRVHELIADELREAILLYEILPGEQLPHERDLAPLFGASRETVRAALASLEAEGLLDRRQGPHAGAFVLPITNRVGDRSPEELADALADLESGLEFREWIEPLAAEVASTRITPGELERLRIVLDWSERDECTQEEFRAADVRFHLGVAKASRNRRLSDSVRGIRVLMNSSLDLIPFTPELITRTIVHHRNILGALRRGDATGARQAMSAHVLRTRAAITGLVRPTDSNVDAGVDVDVDDDEPSAT